MQRHACVLVCVCVCVHVHKTMPLSPLTTCICTHNRSALSYPCAEHAIVILRPCVHVDIHQNNVSESNQALNSDGCLPARDVHGHVCTQNCVRTHVQIQEPRLNVYIYTHANMCRTRHNSLRIVYRKGTTCREPPRLISPSVLPK